VFSQSHTYCDTDPVVSSRSVQLPELRQGVSEQEVDAVLHVDPVKPGGQTHSVEGAVGGAVVCRRGKQIPPFTHSDEPEHRSDGELRSARLVQL